PRRLTLAPSPCRSGAHLGADTAAEHLLAAAGWGRAQDAVSMPAAPVSGSDHLSPPLPSRLQAEGTPACNLRCRMGLVGCGPAYPRSAWVSFESLRALLDSVRGVKELVLQGIGDPLLAPDLCDMIAVAHGCGISVEF